jgi:hypothetical protein
MLTVPLICTSLDRAKNDRFWKGLVKVRRMAVFTLEAKPSTSIQFLNWIYGNVK